MNVKNKNYLRNFWAMSMQSKYVHAYISFSRRKLEKYCKTISTLTDLIELLIIPKSAIINCWYFAIRAGFNEFEGKIILPWAILYSIYIWERSWHKWPAYTCTTHGSSHILAAHDVAFVLTDLHGSYFKIYSNCRDIWRSKCVFYKSDQDTSLSHAAVSN